MTINHASKQFAYSERLRFLAIDVLLAFARFLIAFEFMLYGARKFLHPINIYTRIAEQGLPGSLSISSSPGR
jgi:hypothetical protein